jgi:hypothetical protein
VENELEARVTKKINELKRELVSIQNQLQSMMVQLCRAPGSSYVRKTDTLDHGALSGLSDDDHGQYLLLAGRAGGQTVIGGTASGDDLTLQTTSNVTKGSYIFSEMTTVGYLKNSVAGVVTGGNLGDLPTGSIIGWTGFLTDCPTGFAVCDGTLGTPDLTAEFILL